MNEIGRFFSILTSQVANLEKDLRTAQITHFYHRRLVCSLFVLIVLTTFRVVVVI